MNVIKAPITGSVWKVLVSVGDNVIVGQEVVILESMKMEIPVESEVAGRVTEIVTNEGDFINEEDVIIRLDS